MAVDAKCEFDVSQLSDFGDVVLKTAKDFPRQTTRFMKSEAETLKRRARKKAQKETKKKTGNYIKGFGVGRKVYGYGGAEFNIQVANSMPHAHLIEDGHDITKSKGGPVLGKVPGKHILENAAVEYEPEFAEHIESKLAKKIVEEIEND